jgi:hypothetical protein
MNWRAALRGVAIVLNALFALWLFATAAIWIWGPIDYVGGAVSTVPPLVAIIALLVSGPLEQRWAV